MTNTHQKINELAIEIQRLVQEEIDCNAVKYERYVLIDFANKLDEILVDLNFSLSDQQSNLTNGE